MESLDIGRAFKFTFEDENWIVKVLIGGVISLLSIFLIPIPLLVGYFLTVVEEVYAGRDLPLPEWSNLRQYFSRGLTVTIGSILYSVPILVIACCVLLFTTAISDGQGNADAVGLAILCLYCLMILYGLFLAFWVPGAILRYLEVGSLSGMFQFGQIWQLISRDLGQYFVVILLYIGASFLASIVGSITCGILSPWTSFWAYLVGAHLLGQYWRLHRPPAEQPLATTPA